MACYILYMYIIYICPQPSRLHHGKLTTTWQFSYNFLISLLFTTFSAVSCPFLFNLIFFFIYYSRPVTLRMGPSCLDVFRCLMPPHTYYIQSSSPTPYLRPARKNEILLSVLSIIIIAIYLLHLFYNSTACYSPSSAS